MQITQTASLPITLQPLQQTTDLFLNVTNVANVEAHHLNEWQCCVDGHQYPLIQTGHLMKLLRNKLRIKLLGTVEDKTSSLTLLPET